MLVAGDIAVQVGDAGTAAGHGGVVEDLARRGGQIAGIITRIDLVEYWDRPPASAAGSSTARTTT